MLAPLGDHPHQLGIQRIDAEAVAAMTNRFNSVSARLGRLFSGVPLFEGHHDTDPDTSIRASDRQRWGTRSRRAWEAKYPNGKNFAWVMELQDRAGDGLWGRLKWTADGRAMVQSGNYKFISPVWNAHEIARENGRPVFRPENLLSLALTNLPNLPLPPLANEQAPLILLSPQSSVLGTSISPLANEQSKMNTITQILDLPESATADDICTAVTTLKNSVLSPQSSRLKAALKLPPAATADEICAAAESLAARLGSQSSEIATLQNSIASHNSQFTTERTARIDLILTNAVEKGRITLAQRDEWKTKLEAELEKDLAAAETQLANTAPALNTISLTRDLGNEKAAYDTEATRRAALIGYIAEQQTKGLTYDEAWAKSKLECSEIFEKMVRN